MDRRPRLIIFVSLLSLLGVLLTAFPPRQFTAAAQAPIEPRRVAQAALPCSTLEQPSGMRVFLPIIRSGTTPAPPPANRPPIAGTCSLSLVANTSAAVDLRAAASDPDGDALSWTLDGTPAHGVAVIAGSILTYTPSAGYDGSDTVRYTLSDGRGGTATGSVTLTVRPATPTDNEPPSVTLDATALSGTFPLTVTFTANATDANGDALTYAWDFGDGTEGGNQASITHVYSRTGLFEARVTVRDGTSIGAAAAEVRVSSRPGDPPDPLDTAPPVDQTVPTTLISSTEFLYTGPSPIQIGVPPGTIDPKLAAVVRGRVMTRDGAPLAGVKVAVLDHPEYGHTLSRGDGYFDLAVNGARLTITYEKTGFLPAQRKADPPWGGWAHAPDVALIALDPVVTTIDPASSDPAKRVARGSTVTDEDGTRRATLLFPQGVTATMVVDGQPVPMTTLRVRATEYTVGPNGPEAMPGELPPSSGYTYAVELSADEAIAAGATEVRFSKPVPFYLENFLDFPVGMSVPTGFYDRAQGEWLADRNGRVIKVLAVGGGTATLDIDGDGAADGADKLAALGISADELARVAGLYTAGTTLWRVPLTHFTPWDCNWPFGPPPGSGPPGPNGPNGPKGPNGPGSPNDPCKKPGSVISCETQVLGEQIAVVGTPYRLHYESDRVEGRSDRRKVTLPLSGATLPPGVKRIQVELRIAGQLITRDFPAAPNQSLDFVWNGRDVYGRVLQGTQFLRGRVGYTYEAVYQEPADFENAFAALSGVPITGNSSRREITLWQDFQTMLGAWEARAHGLGGWSLDVHHAYDPVRNTLYLGDGERRGVAAVGAMITTVAGDGVAFPSFDGDGGPATEATLSLDTSYSGLDVEADGSLLIADTANHRVRRVDRNGIISTVAGNGTDAACFASLPVYSDPAEQTSICRPRDVAVAPDGTLYIITANARTDLLKVTPDGMISLVMKRDLAAPCGGPSGGIGDGGPAARASICMPQSIATGSDGSLYIADTHNFRIRRVGPDGIITTIAGTGQHCNDADCGEGGPARAAPLDYPYGIAVGPDGSVYGTFGTGTSGGAAVRRVWPDGHISTIARSTFREYSGDGGPALEARLNFFPADVAVDDDGTIFVADANNDVVRQIGQDGIITTLAGAYYGGYYTHGSNATFAGDNGPAARAYMTYPSGLAVGPDGSLVIADTYNDRIRRVAPALPVVGGAGAILIPSEDGAEMYVFRGSGRHRETRDLRTGALRLLFDYDPAGRLSAVTDGDGNRTTITRDAAGAPTAITGPYGRSTTLALDVNGFLNRVVAPDGATTTLTSNAGGLLQSLRDPRGNLHRYGYDDVGRLVRDENPAGGVTRLARTEALSSTTVAVTDPLGRVTTFEVTRLPSGDTRRTTIDPGGTRTDVLIDADGSRTASYADGSRMTEAPGPDPRWGMLAPLTERLVITTTAGLTTTMATSRTVEPGSTGSLLVPGVLTETTVINGRPFTSVLVAGGDGTRTETTTTPEGRQRLTVLDARGRVTSIRLDAALAPLTIAYDARGRISRIGQGGQSWSYSYDAFGQLGGVTDASGQEVVYSRDSAGRATGVTLPGARTYAMAYDANGNLAAITPPGGQQHTLTYGALDLLAGYTPPGGAASSRAYDAARGVRSNALPSGRAITWNQDASGRPAGVVYPEATTTYGYADATDRITSITRTPASGTAQRLDLTYDGPLETSVRFTGPAQGEFRFTYGREFLLRGLDFVAGADTWSRALGYDDDGLLSAEGPFVLARSGPAGAVSRIGDGTLVFDLAYDALGRVARRTSTVGGTPASDHRLTFDAAGRLARKVETVAGASHTYVYRYDPSGQLAEVTRDGAVVERYTYDVRGNRTSRTVGGGTAETATYDAQDRLLERDGTAYTFDDDGFLARRGVDTFISSARGELLSATVGGQTVTYAYDGYGRRVARTAGGATTQYLYGNPEQSFQVTATRDPAGVLSSYFYDAQGLLYAFARGATRFYVATDQVGSPRVVADASGTAVKVVDYDSWGNVVSDSAPAFVLPFGYAGGIADEATGLVRFGFRDYEPAAGRWTARDPALFDAGQSNLYAYVDSSPLAQRDPTGLVTVGYSQYDGYGGGGKITIGTNGITVCGEIGLGVGGGIEFNPYEEAGRTGWSEKAELMLQFGPAGLGGGVKLDDCGKITPYGKAKLGPIGYDTKKGTTAKADPGDLNKDIGDLATKSTGFKATGKVAAEGCINVVSW